MGETAESLKWGDVKNILISEFIVTRLVRGNYLIWNIRRLAYKWVRNFGKSTVLLVGRDG